MTTGRLSPTESGSRIESNLAVVLWLYPHGAIPQEDLATRWCSKSLCVEKEGLTTIPLAAGLARARFVWRSQKNRAATVVMIGAAEKSFWGTPPECPSVVFGHATTWARVMLLTTILHAEAMRLSVKGTSFGADIRIGGPEVWIGLSNCRPVTETISAEVVLEKEQGEGL